MTRFSDVFEGIGKFPGKAYKIQLDPKMPPKQTPCRPVPIHLNPYHAERYLQLVSNYAKCDYSRDQSKCSTMPSVTIVT